MLDERGDSDRDCNRTSERAAASPADRAGSPVGVVERPRDPGNACATGNGCASHAAPAFAGGVCADEGAPGPQRAHVRAREGLASEAGREGEAAFDEDVLCALASAVLCPDRAESESLLQDILDAGIPRDVLVDVYIPRAARRFGAAWSDGGHSFAEVTIGVGRLQGWLRELDRMGPGAGRDAFCLDAPEVLLVVAEGAHHTLGAMVAMAQFRRLGALVRLSLGQDARMVGRMARSQHFDMVAISAAGNEDLDFLAELISCIRSGAVCAPDIVLGGEILNHNPDAPSLIGADHATSDPKEALRLCGRSRPADARPSLPAERATSRGQPGRARTPT